MEIIWTSEAEESLTEIAMYWADRNSSSDYSEKIISEVEKLLKDISSNPFYIGRYIQKLDLYTRSILKGKFIIYFSKGDNDTIEIHYFRSSKQRPIEELLS